MALTLATLTSVVLVPTVVTACGAYTVIDSRGSSSVQPFLAALGNEYSNSGHNVEISVQAGGSSNGIKWVSEGLTTLGNASKNPKSTVVADSQLSQNWKDKNIKTISLAKDGIGVVYKAPEGYANQFAVSNDNILDLYEGFAGSQPVPLNKFYIGSGSLPDQNFIIHGFARAGGSTTSGTAEAFLKDSGFNNGQKISKTVSNILSKGDYGELTKTTSESNAEAYTYFKSNASAVGSMIYLSLGYIQNNLQVIQTDGFSVLKYQTDQGIFDANLKNVEDNNYKWWRPLDTMVALTTTSSLAASKLAASQQFIEWILFNQYLNVPSDEQKNIQDIFANEGVIPLTDSEKMKMFNLATVSNLATADLQTLVSSYMNLFWQGDYQFSNPTFGL